MSRLRYRVTAVSDVLLAQSSGERNTVSTYDYIPGTTMLGIFAAKYIKKEKLNTDDIGAANDNDKFRSIFLDGKVKFTNCYLVGKGAAKQEKCFQPIPRALSHEKRNTDSYLNQLAAGEQPGHKLADGYGDLIIQDHKLVIGKVEKSLNFHHERDPETGSSKKGMIFNYEAIKSGTVFEGELIGESDSLDTLKGLITESETLYAGRSKSAQYGAIKIQFLNDNKNEVSGSVTSENMTELDGEVAITLLSDLIIYSEYGSSTSDYNELEEYLKAKIGANLTIEKLYLSQVGFENYVGHWKLKKPLDTCFAKGSCFVIKGANTAKLRELEVDGIGERTGEGFGQFRFDFPGTQDIEPITNVTSIKKDVNNPAGDVPEEVMQIANKIIRNEAIKKATKEGADKGIKVKGWSTSFPGKLWNIFLENNKDRTRFVAELKNLPDKARNKLMDSYIDNSSIMSILETDRKYSEEFSGFGDMKEKPTVIYSNKKELYEAFLKAFLTSARRKAKEIAATTAINQDNSTKKEVARNV